MILVERAALRVHGLVVGPGLGNHHHHRVRQRAAGEDEELERVVEHRRVGTVGVHDREDLPDVVTEELALEESLAGVHPVDVAAERVDLAVVREVAVGMRALPARERVGRETRMHEREGRLHRGVLQVGEVVVHLVGGEHALVNEGARREARDIPGLGAGEGRGADLAVGTLPDDVELALEGEFVGQLRRAGDERLPHERLGGLGGVAQRGVLGRHGAPSEELAALGLHDLLETLLYLAADGGVARQEDQAGAVLADLGQGETERLADLGEKLVRELDEDAGTVAGIDLGAAGAAVVQVAQDLQPVLDHLVRLAAFHVHDEADAAGIVLEPRIVKALLAGTDGGIVLDGHGGVQVNGRIRRGFQTPRRQDAGSLLSTRAGNQRAVKPLVATMFFDRAKMAWNRVPSGGGAQIRQEREESCHKPVPGQPRGKKEDGRVLPRQTDGRRASAGSSRGFLPRWNEIRRERHFRIRDSKFCLLRPGLWGLVTALQSEIGT